MKDHDHAARGHAITTKESLYRFGTMAFGIETIEDRIDFDISKGSIGIALWLLTVPEAYRQSAESAALRACSVFMATPRKMLHNDHPCPQPDGVTSRMVAAEISAHCEGSVVPAWP